MTNSEFNHQLDHLNNHLTLFEEYIPQLLLQFDNSLKSPNSIQWFTFGMLQRLLNLSIPLKTLLPEYLENRISDFAIGILIRPIVLDGLIGMNLLGVLKKGLAQKLEYKKLINEVDCFCKGALADGLIQTLQYFTQMKSNDLIEEDELFKMYNHFAEEYSDFLFQPAGINSMPKLRHPIKGKPFQHFDTLVKDLEMKAIAHRFYELFTIYSKYDHFGFLYFDVMRAEKELKNDRIKAAIDLFINHFANLCDLLERVTPENDTIKSVYLESKKYLENNQKVKS